MLIELAGHAYNLTGMCTTPEGEDYEETYLAVVSKNTKPDEKPWRMTIHSQEIHSRGKSTVVHVQLDDEYSYLSNPDNDNWEDGIIKAVREYINNDCNFIESEPITREQMTDMVASHIRH